MLQSALPITRKLALGRRRSGVQRLPGAGGRRRTKPWSRPDYTFVRNSPGTAIDPLGLSVATRFCNAILPYVPGTRYVWRNGKCYNLGCVHRACARFVSCVGSSLGGMTANLGRCIFLAAPCAAGGPAAYGYCLAFCASMDTAGTILNLSTCWSAYRGQYSGCRVRGCFCGR